MEGVVTASCRIDACCANYLARSSNSPSRTPSRNAAISARVYTRVGPSGKRELRIAISPEVSSASSTQLPLGLLAVALRQASPHAWVLLNHLHVQMFMQEHLQKQAGHDTINREAGHLIV